jgi:hypothetical protein
MPERDGVTDRLTGCGGMFRQYSCRSSSAPFQLLSGYVMCYILLRECERMVSQLFARRRDQK